MTFLYLFRKDLNASCPQPFNRTPQIHHAEEGKSVGTLWSLTAAENDVGDLDPLSFPEPLWKERGEGGVEVCDQLSGIL